MPLKIRTYHQLGEIDSNLPDQLADQGARLASRLERVERVVGVMSGKGGVGKSLVSALLAASLAQRGRRVGLIDADLNGPSSARLLGIEPKSLRDTDAGLEPAVSRGGVKLMSMAFLIELDSALTWHEPADAGFVWRGAQERTALREFLADVAWGDLDMLIIDLPPGTQRLAELHGLVPQLAGVVAVTIPSVASRDAVARSLDLARARSLTVLGLVENMAGFRCAGCGALGALHAGEAGEDLSRGFEVPLLARLPLDPGLGAAADAGEVEAWLAEDTSLGGEIHDLADAIAGVPAGKEGS